MESAVIATIAFGCAGIVACMILAGRALYERGWWAGFEHAATARRPLQLADRAVIAHVMQSIARGSIAPEELRVIREHAPQLAFVIGAVNGLTMSELMHASAAHRLRIVITTKGITE